MRRETTTKATRRRGQRGAALVEFAIAATVLLALIFAVLELGRLLWVHNALTDAARRGARYAVNQPKSDKALAEIRNVAIYGNPAGTGSPLVNDLTADKVVVTHAGWGVAAGTVTVEIHDYDFNFVVPVVGTTIRMPRYRTTLTGENSGWVPNNI
ncbi:MAG TPA: TadE family protein [Pyrinomonadaceae bacterium]